MAEADRARTRELSQIEDTLKKAETTSWFRRNGPGEQLASGDLKAIAHLSRDPALAESPLGRLFDGTS